MATTPALIKPAAYARLRGCSRESVSKAIEAGRISTINGLIDPVVADIQWKQNTRARTRAVNAARHASAPAAVAPQLPLTTTPPDLQPPGPQPSPAELPSPPVRGDDDYQASRSRREKAEAEMAELKLQEQLGQVVNAEAARAEYAKHVSAVRDAALQLGGRLAPIFAAEIDVAKIQAMLDAELRAVLALFAEKAA